MSPMKATRCFWLVSIVLAMGAQPTKAEIKVQGDTLVFTQETDKKMERHEEPFSRVVRFKRHMSLDAKFPKVAMQHLIFLFDHLRSDVLQGLDFSVPKDKKFAVVSSYFCTQLQMAAEVPYVCKSVFQTIDPQGKPIGHGKGNFISVQAHDSLPYFILKQDSCCDGIPPASLYSLDGKKVCQSKKRVDPSWVTRKSFDCGGKMIRLKE